MDEIIGVVYRRRKFSLICQIYILLISYLSRRVAFFSRNVDIDFNNEIYISKISFIVVLLITFIICNYLNVNARANDIDLNDINIATVSAYGTITGKNKGMVIINGTYKYNANYKVRIELTVLS